jgi:3-isopropylmalate dehydrogenase
MTQERTEGRKRAKLLACLTGRDVIAAPTRPLIGVVEGAGIGPEVIGAALQVLASAGRAMDINFEVQCWRRTGHEAGAELDAGQTDARAKFCATVFQSGGAILHGPEGGRYVYDLRRRCDLFCKFVPVKPSPELARAARLVPKHLRGVDILIVRDNSGGVYQGEWGEQATAEGRVAEHTFRYSEAEVQRLVEIAARAAAGRRGNLHVIIKDSGVPTVSALWREVAGSVARKHGIEAAFMNVDLAAYELIQNPARFDVVVTPNLFGDILADIAGVLVSSRGVTFSGNFNAHGHGIYQTNHGCALDLAGTDTANPAGQILSLAMLLRESFGLEEAAALIESSLAEVWRQGWRTADLDEPGCTILGTKAMTERVAQQIFRWSEVKQSHEPRAAAG